jgi:hypothetical protein
LATNSSYNYSFPSQITILHFTCTYGTTNPNGEFRIKVGHSASYSPSSVRNMSAYHSETSFEATSLFPAPDALPSDSDPLFPSQLNDDLNDIGIHGFDEFNPPFNDEFKLKAEEATLDNSGLDPNWLDFDSVSKDDVKFPDRPNLSDVNAIADSDELSSQQFLAVVFGEDQSTVEFPDLQLTNDVFVAANKESAVDIFPVNLQRSKLIVESQSFGQSAKSPPSKYRYV